MQRSKPSTFNFQPSTIKALTITAIVIRAVLFDFIGTTVLERDSNMINSCFADAFLDHGIKVSKEIIKAGRGKDKREMITGVLEETNNTSTLIDPILDSLTSRIENNLDNFYENDGANEI